MAHQLFLSHDSRDHERAEILSRMIGRITLGQISVWNSSDSSANGGLKPGQVWLDEIRARLAVSKAIVVLLTPTSLSRPWLLFESGFGAAQLACDVIPVCLGIDRLGDIPFPLAMYQTYQLSDYESLKRFTHKLTAKYEIQFDEEMAEPVILEAVMQLSQARSTLVEKGDSAKEPTISEAISSLKEHIDKRLLSFISLGTTSVTLTTDVMQYNVAINLNLKKKGKSTQFIEIGPGTTVQEVFNNVYFMLKGEVEPFKYLEQWVLRDLGTKEHLVVREIQYRIPAKVLFTPGSKWEVVKLPKPYVATDQLLLLPGKDQ